jgi:hypothetical protein
MSRPGIWIAAAATVCVTLACDPKPSKPTDPPKPIAQASSLQQAVDQR